MISPFKARRLLTQKLYLVSLVSFAAQPSALRNPAPPSPSHNVIGRPGQATLSPALLVQDKEVLSATTCREVVHLSRQILITGENLQTISVGAGVAKIQYARVENCGQFSKFHKLLLGALQGAPQ